MPDLEQKGSDLREIAPAFHGVFQAKTLQDLEKVYDSWAETYDETLENELSGDGVNHPVVELLATLREAKAMKILLENALDSVQKASPSQLIPFGDSGSESEQARQEYEAKRDAELSLSQFRTVNILDCGCGTGAAGRHLKEGLFTHALGKFDGVLPGWSGMRANLIGFDLSLGMLKKCNPKYYQKVAQGVCPDMTSAIQALNETQEYFAHISPEASHFVRSKKFDLTFCAGVFTPNHAPPTTLEKLVEITNPGGLISFSIRTYFYEDESSGFKQEIQRLVEEKKWSKVHCEQRVYLPKETVYAFYFVFQVL